MPHEKSKVKPKPPERKTGFRGFLEDFNRMILPQPLERWAEGPTFEEQQVDYYNKLVEQQAERLRSQAAGEMTPADIAQERNIMGQAGQLGQNLGQQAGASFGRRGLAWSPAAADVGIRTRTAVGQGALEVLQRNRAERQSMAEGRLANLQMGQLEMAQQEQQRKQQESAEFNELLITVLGLMAGDPELAALFSGGGGGGGNAPGVMQTLGG